jgi:16S rRNA (guanine(966)-N(2))-methyltransferase RsmD
MSLRIISGQYRGKRITAPKKLPVRPTTDMAKESLFNILNNSFYFDEIKALDLFSGTGNISYELASRGCTDIIAVDSSRPCVNFIDKTSDELNTTGLFPVLSDVIEFLKRDINQYDLIFADPPYEYEEYDKLVDLVFTRKLLKEGGVLVLEHQSRSDLSELPHYQSSRKYGNVKFSFFELEETEET